MDFSFLFKHLASCSGSVLDLTGLEGEFPFFTIVVASRGYPRDRVSDSLLDPLVDPVGSLWLDPALENR